MIAKLHDAQRASNVDMVWTQGYGWRRHTGGSMSWADHVGLDKVVDALNEYRHVLGAGFGPPPLLVCCAAARQPLDRETAR